MAQPYPVLTRQTSEFRGTERGQLLVQIAGPGRAEIGRKGGKSPSYADWSKEDLVKRAREIGIKGRSTMTKAELVKALRNH